MGEQGARPAAELAFGEALSELEGIVTQLESGQLELEDGIARYERGVALLGALQSKLTEAQQKVSVLIGELEPEAERAEEDEPA